jgi:GNAT superfamily N-acetyltransferase
MSSYFISTDQSALDVEFIVRSLQSTYWAGDRSRDTIVGSLATSLCFGVYEAESRAQVGIARIITDGVTFSWLCDVFVAPAHRGHGLGKRLVAEIIAHPNVAGTKVYLATKDAHALYERFGFQKWELMRRAPDEPNKEP